MGPGTKQMLQTELAVKKTKIKAKTSFSPCVYAANIELYDLWQSSERRSQSCTRVQIL